MRAPGGFSSGRYALARLVCCLPTAAVLLAAGGDDAPRYEAIRHDENWSYLADEARRSDPFDPIKYMPLSDTREGWYMTVGGEVRERFEYFHNEDWDSANGSDAFLLQRYMVFADLHFGPRVRLFTHVKSALENGREAGPRPVDEDRLDLHEAFMDVGIGGEERVTLRAGRQEISFGSQRLVSIRKGPNVRRSFDGVDVIVRAGSWRLDAFATRPVATDPGVFDDGIDHDRSFWGIYATGPLQGLEGMHADFYLLGLERKDAEFDQGTEQEIRESVGARVWGESAGWDYNFEAVYQWGRFGTAPINAWTFASDTGFTFQDAAGRPRLGLKADVTSGDRDPDDAALQSFNPLFPRGSYFGENPKIGPVNHIDLHPSIDLHVHSGVTLTPSWLFFWRESLDDGLYDVGVNLVRSGAGTRARYVGSQPELVVTWDLNRHVSVVGDVAYFLAGPFLRESGPGDDLLFVAGWVEVTF